MDYNHLRKVGAVIAIFAIGSCGGQKGVAHLKLASMRVGDFYEPGPQLDLANAVNDGDVRRIDSAISKGADVNAVGRDDMTMLAWAFLKKEKRGFLRLLERGANPNYRTSGGAWNDRGSSVMLFSAINEDGEFLRLALRYGGVPDAPHSEPGKTILFAAVQNGRGENVRLLSARGADLNHRDLAGFTPLMQAVFATRYDMVHLLLELGADPSIKTDQGSNLRDLINDYGNSSISVLGKEREQRAWYERVVNELKRRGD